MVATYSGYESAILTTTTNLDIETYTVDIVSPRSLFVVAGKRD